MTPLTELWPVRPSLRWLLVGCFVVITITGLAVGAVFYFDIHGPPEQTTVSLDQSPSEVIRANNELLLQVEHRTITTVSRVSDNGTTRLYRFEDVYDYSDHQYLALYETSSDWIYYRHHHGIRASYAIETGSHYLGYVHEGWAHVVNYPGVVNNGTASVAVDWNDRSDDGRIIYRRNDSLAGIARYGAPRVYDRAAYHAMFVNHSVDWERSDETDSTVTYSIDQASEYAKVRPIIAESVLDGSRMSVTVSKQTGRIQSMTEHRIVNKSVGYGDQERTEPVHLLVQTRIRDYEGVDVTRPDGLAPPPLEHYWDDLLDY